MSTLSDELLWQLTVAPKVPEFVTEFKFHPLRRFRFDIAWPDRMVACEVDGGTWIGGRHTSGAGFERDAEKFNEAAILGWRVLRVTAAMVRDGRALEYVERALARKEV